MRNIKMDLEIFLRIKDETCILWYILCEFRQRVGVDQID